MQGLVKRAALVSTIFLSMVRASAAESPADFYRGKQLRMIVSTSAGTVFDTYARLLSRYIIKYIPGPPSAIIVVNMPGGGGLLAMDFLANIAPKDGSVLAMSNQGLPLYQSLHLGNALKADVRQLNWIGNLSDSNQVLATWHTSPTRTLSDAKRRVTTVGVAGAGSITTQLPEMYNNMLGTKLKLVAGYISGTDINLAMERGEVEGRGSNTWASYVALNPTWVRDHKINILLQVGLKKEAALPDVPLLIDLAKTDEQRTAFGMMSSVAAISRPIVTTSNVPKERVQALRRAFDLSTKDPSFLYEAKKLRLDVSTMNGEALQRVISKIVDAPANVRETVKLAIQP